MTTTSRIDVREVDGVKVIRFHDQHLFDERTVREVADQIAAALPNDGGPIRVVLDFSGVSLISSSLLSKLICFSAGWTTREGGCGCARSPRSSSRSSAPPTSTASSSIDRDQRTSLSAF